MPEITALQRADTLFFDLDGVIVDSREPITRCMNAALQAIGQAPEPARALERFIGPPLHAAFAEVLKLRGLPEAGIEAQAEACVAAYRSRYRSVSLETPAFEGIPAVLAVLCDRYRLAIATSKPEAFARPILEARQLDHHFDHVAAPPLEATHLEDKTATLGHGLAALGLERPRAGAGAPAVMIGDRASDIAAGRHHGLPTVGVAWGIGGAEELRGAGADWIVASPTDLLAILGG